MLTDASPASSSPNQPSAPPHRPLRSSHRRIRSGDVRHLVFYTFFAALGVLGIASAFYFVSVSGIHLLTPRHHWIRLASRAHDTQHLHTRVAATQADRAQAHDAKVSDAFFGLDGEEKKQRMASAKDSELRLQQQQHPDASSAIVAAVTDVNRGTLGQHEQGHNSIAKLKGETDTSAAGNLTLLQGLHVPIWWMAPLLDSSSFGNEAITLMMCMVEQRVLAPPLMWAALLQNQCADEASHLDRGVHAFIQAALAAPGKAKHLTQDAIVVCHNLPKYFGRPGPQWASCSPCPPQGFKGRAIARTMAETTRFDSSFVAACNSLDEVWVPSEFSRQVLASSGVAVDKLHVVPIAVNTTYFTRERHQPLELPLGIQVFGPVRQLEPKLQSSKAIRTHLKAPTKNSTATSGSLTDERSNEVRPFVFLSVFKWEERKGWATLLKAYLEEFTGSEAVELIILTKPFSGTGDFAGEMQKWAKDHIPKAESSKLPRLSVLKDYVTSEVYAQLLATAHAFVSPTRGEGWDLPVTEAMSMALPVLATNWSGLTAYLDSSVGYPLQFQLVDVPADQPSWFSGSKWADVSVPHLRSCMRAVYRDEKDRKRRGQAARARMLERYSPQAMATVLSREFIRVQNGIKRAAHG